jgi:hypothetical protein
MYILIAVICIVVALGTLAMGSRSVEIIDIDDWE